MVTSEGAIVDAEVAQKPQRSRVGCILKTLGCGCGTIVLLALLAGGIGAWRYRQWRHVNEQYVEQELGRIQAAGEPMTVDELNACYRVPEGEVILTHQWIHAFSRIEEAFEQEPREFDDQLKRMALEPYETGDKSSTVEADVASYLERHEPEIDRVVNLSRQKGPVAFPHVFDETLNMPLYQAQHLRFATYLMCASAKACVAQGENHKAAGRLLAALDMIGTLDRSPTIVEHLVQRAALDIAETAIINAANHGILTTEETELLAARLGDFDFVEGQRAALIGERAIYHEVMTTPGEIIRAGQRVSEEVTGPGKKAVAGPIDRATGLRWTGRLIELSEADYGTCKLEVDSLTAESRRLQANRFEMLHNIYSLLLIPALFKTQEPRFRDEARKRITRAGLLAITHHRRHGEWPASVEELDFGTDTKAMLDPYTGELLRFAMSSEGLKVYSVGPNQLNDEGVELKKGGYPSGEPDIVVTFRYIDSQSEPSMEVVSP